MHDKLVTIATFIPPTPDPGGMAELAKLELKFADIPCFLSGLNFTNMHWLRSVANRGISLQVKHSDVERALAILEETHTAEPDETDDFFVCPGCSAADVTYEKFSRFFLCLSLLTFGIPLTFLKRTYRCNACPHKWKDEKK